jgi:Ulp1 family protease
MKELETINPDLANDTHVFSSFFYKLLNKKKYVLRLHKNHFYLLKCVSFDEGYNSVRKWTSKFDIFSKKYLIVPINEKLASNSLLVLNLTVC